MSNIQTTEGYFNTDISDDLFTKLYANNIQALIKNESNDDYKSFVQNSINQIIIDPRKTWSPHVNGWYYVNMVHGSWAYDLMDTTKKYVEEYKEFSPDPHLLIPRAIKNMGHLIKDIDPTQLNIEYETISGRVRNVQHATRIMSTSEFSLTFKENRELDNFRYHEFWFDYIEAYKKGFISSPSGEDSYTSNPFIKIPYLNAVWIVLFKPFSFELQGLIKIMGATPTGLPIKEVMGQRSGPQVTTYSINYKAVDTIMVMYGDAKPSGLFYEDFLADSKNFF